MNVRDSVALVTGANRGLGRAFVDQLLARGAKKVYAGVRSGAAPADATPGVVWVQMDVGDPASLEAAAKQCNDVTLLVNNAGIARLLPSILDTSWIGTAREIFETNFYGLVRATQSFTPSLTKNGGGAIINVLSDAAWFSPPLLSAYAATKSAAWSFTNATRTELGNTGTRVLGVHVGFMDTDMTKGLDVSKTSPIEVASAALDALERGFDEVLVDEGTRAIKRSLSGAKAHYLNVPEPA